MNAAAVYLRVSTDSQTLENQREPLSSACAARGFEPRWFEEVESAAKARPVLDAMLAAAHRGEVKAVVVVALDRLGRSLRGVLDTVHRLDAAGVRLISLREPWLDTGGPARSLLVAIFAWVAEMERGTLIERTKAGMKRAARQGKRIGRPTLAQKDPEAHRRLVQAAAILDGDSTFTVAEVARHYRVSERSLRRFRAAAKGSGSIPPPADVATGA